MKNNKIPEIQQVEAALTESEVLPLPLSLSFSAYVKKFKATDEGRTCFGWKVEWLVLSLFVLRNILSLSCTDLILIQSVDLAAPKMWCSFTSWSISSCLSEVTRRSPALRECTFVTLDDHRASESSVRRKSTECQRSHRCPLYCL